MDDTIRDKIELFFNSFPLVKYPKDQILIFPGELSDKTFHLVTGRVCQYDISYRGDEIIVNTFKPPAFFPMAMAINRIPSGFFYKTETEASIRVARSEEVVKFIRDNPDITFDLLSRVYRGIEPVLERMIHLMSGTARSRLIFDLLLEYKRFGKNKDGKKYIEANETSIAARSGLSRETISREMRHLKDSGLVRLSDHKIFINDIVSLEQELGVHL